MFVIVCFVFSKTVQIGALVNENKQNPLVCNACNLCGVNTPTVLLLLIFFCFVLEYSQLNNVVTVLGEQ